MDEAEGEQVVRDEVRREVTGVFDVFGWIVGREIEGGEVRNLDRVEDDPERWV